MPMRILLSSLAIVSFHVIIVKLFPISVVSSLRSRIKSKLREKGLSSANAITVTNKIDHTSREVVIPCPDFSYGVGLLEGVAGNSAVLIDAPANSKLQYANLGLYNDKGIAVHSFVYGKEGMKIVLLSNSSSSSNGTAMRNYYTPLGYKAVFVSGSSFIVLQRLLLTASLTYEDAATHTSKMKITLDGNGSDPIDLILPMRWALVLLIVIICAHTLRIDIEPLALVVLNESSQCLVPVAVAFAISAALNGVFIGFLNNSNGFLSLVSTREVSGWIFTFPLDSGATITHLLYLDLVLLLHGALGLGAKDVVYGKLAVDSGGDLLRTDRSYLLDISDIQTRSKWFTVTLYGEDKYLMQNDFDIYSVTTFQLKQLWPKPKAIYISAHPRSDEPFIPLNCTGSTSFMAIIRMYEPCAGFSLDDVKLPQMKAII